MTNYLMREPLVCQPEPRIHSRVEVERPDEGTSQRYLALAALKAPQNLPQRNTKHPHQQHGIMLWEIWIRMDDSKQTLP